MWLQTGLCKTWLEMQRTTSLAIRLIRAISCDYSTFHPLKDGLQLSCVMRKPDFCLCKNKDADQLRGNRKADQRLCFRYTDSAIPLLSESEISSL